MEATPDGQLQYLEYNDGAGVQPVRSVEVDGKLWFVAQDIAQQMRMQRTSDLVKLIKSEHTTHAHVQTPRSVQLMRVVSVEGIVHAANRSRSPFATRLQEWAVTLTAGAIEQQIYPTPSGTSLRAAQGAAAGMQIVSLDDMERLAAAVMQAVSIAREQQARADALESNLAAANQDLDAANRAIEVWTEGDEHHTMQGTAHWLASKGVKVGRTRLYEVLRDFGWVCKGSTAPTQYAINSGWAAVEHIRINGVGVKITTRITSKGLDRLFRKMTAPAQRSLEVVREA